MKVLSTVVLTLLAKAIGAAALHNENDYHFTPVHPPEFEVKVPSELFIIMCENENFGEPCDGGYVSPGLCYYAPDFGVTAVRPAKDISGCTLYNSTDCNFSAGDLPNVASPGIPNLTSEGFNDITGSFICY